MLIPTTTTVNAQFNEPPGKRREQTFRVEEFELSNINQHYPGDIRYYCTFRGKWTKERHPNDFPKNPSFSAPVIVSHSKDWRMWSGTESVTAGVEYMAEEGFPTILYNEFQNAGFESLQMIVGERMFNTSESQELPPINVTYSHPWLSSMSKIIPSPDWFVGFSDLRTISYDTETYYNRIVVKSYVWDAGTDEGESYHSFDKDLDPQVPCSRFCVPPNVGGGGSGTFDSNVVHHPTSSLFKCPDKEKGTIPIPRGGQFLDYTASYIPYVAEYECVLRIGDGEVYAGNAFDESQIRPPRYVPRPDDDYLDGISPYDQPAYDNYVLGLNRDDPAPEEEGWNTNLLWLLLLLLLCCCAPFCAVFAMWRLFYRQRKKRSGKDATPGDADATQRQSGDEDDLFLDEASAEYESSQNSYYDDDANAYGDAASTVDDEDDDYAKFLLSSQQVSQQVVFQDDDEQLDDTRPNSTLGTELSMSSYRDGDVI